MKKLKILVVCSRNKKRSLTAETIFKNDSRVIVRSVGTSPSARRKITQADIDWADIILCMERKHKQIIEQQFGKIDSQVVRILDIADEYEYMDPELVEMLQREIEFILSQSPA